MQLVGFGAGVGLLVWCGMTALKPENRAQLARLGEADPLSLAMLFGFSLATLLLNGQIFWVVLRPEKRIDPIGMQATNAVATTLSYLPFKLSVLLRVAVHNRRDRVPLLTIAAWFGAVSVLVLVGLGPPAAMSVWRRGIDAVWWAGSLVGIGLALAVTLGLAGFFAGKDGLVRIHRVLDPLRIGPLSRFIRGGAFARLHAIFAMLAHPRAVLPATVLRLLDIAAQTARFTVAASILGVGLGWQQALLIASTYFLIGMLSPFGMLGTREAGAVGLAQLLGISDAGDSLVVVILAVSATESLVNLVCAGAGVAWLRPDRLIGGVDQTRSGTGTPDAS